MGETTYLYNGRVHTGITVLPHGTVIIKDGLIKDVISNERFEKRKAKGLPEGSVIYDLKGANVSPGFIDTHIHGVHGYGTDDGTTESILEMSKALVEYGVAGFCPTLYPCEEKKFLQTVENIVAAMGKEEGAKILGLHLEGPFLSKAKKGVQREEFIKDVDLKFMKELYDIAGDNIRIMTVAPELKNMRELALYCTQMGTILSAGHSNATYDNMLEGMQAGILHSTHFFNAMRRLHHRDPGVVGAIFLHTDVSCEVIADGFHVHPSLIRLLMREKPADKIVLVTDALKPTGQTEGTLIANGEEVYLSDDDVFKRTADDVIAGSSLTMFKGVENLYNFGISLDVALRMASSNPASVLQIDRDTGFLMPNLRADIAVFTRRFEMKMNIIGGEIKLNNL